MLRGVCEWTMVIMVVGWSEWSTDISLGSQGTAALITANSISTPIKVIELCHLGVSHCHAHRNKINLWVNQ